MVISTKRRVGGRQRKGRMRKGLSHVGDAFVTRLQREKHKRTTGGRKEAELSDVAGCWL